jgi:hypothetical protein
LKNSAHMLQTPDKKYSKKKSKRKVEHRKKWEDRKGIRMRNEYRVFSR